MNKIFFFTITALFILSTAANCGQSTAEKTAASTLLLSVAAFGKGQYASDRLTGIHISYSHMTRYSMKSFTLREVNGEIVFSCHFYSEETEIKMDEVSVSPEYMQRMREITKKHDFASLKERKTTNRPFVRDVPMYNMTLYWPDKKYQRLNYWPDNGMEELENFFRELACKHTNKSVH